MNLSIPQRTRNQNGRTNLSKTTKDALIHNYSPLILYHYVLNKTRPPVFPHFLLYIRSRILTKRSNKKTIFVKSPFHLLQRGAVAESAELFRVLWPQQLREFLPSLSRSTAERLSFLATRRPWSHVVRQLPEPLSALATFFLLFGFVSCFGLRKPVDSWGAQFGVVIALVVIIKVSVFFFFTIWLWSGFLCL